MRFRDPVPEIVRLETLALDIKQGAIRLPKFQRPFVWQKPDMLKLLDSIYRGYPIGSILVWNSSQMLNSEKEIAGITVNVEDRTVSPANFLLDGQQRLTTICGALYWDGSEERAMWNIGFDLDKEAFIHIKDQNAANIFPLNKLIETSDFIRQCMRYESHPDGKKYYELSEKLLRTFKDYKIAVVKLGDMTIEEVAPIFERINSTGRRLTMVDLMMAATWSDYFDLSVAISEIKKACSDVGFSDVPEGIVLRSVAASAGLGINKADIQKLRELKADKLQQAVGAAKEALVKALSFVRDEFNIRDFGYVPYALQINLLAEFFRISGDANNDGFAELRRWFWFTSATRHFGGANTGQISRELARFRGFAGGRDRFLFDRVNIDISPLLFDKFNLRNASSTVFSLLLNLMSPKKTLDGREIDDGHLKIKQGKFFGVFSPSLELFDKNVSRVIHPYIGEEITDVGVDAADFSRHLLDAGSIDARRAGDAEKYVSARGEILRQLLSKLTECEVIFSPQGGGMPLGEEEIGDPELIE